MDTTQASPADTPPDASAPVSAPSPRFGPSPRALLQRRVLSAILAALLWLGLAWVLGAVGAAGSPWSRLRWWLSAVAALGLWRLVRAAALRPLVRREVLLHEQALELRHGAFRRLAVFANIRHLRTVQSPSGRLWSLRLDLEDDSVTLRDLDGLPRIFAAAAQRRPAGVLIEVEVRRVDWAEPLPWMLLVLALGLLGALAALV
jgi:hypothetical protein